MGWRELGRAVQGGVGLPFGTIMRSPPTPSPNQSGRDVVVALTLVGTTASVMSTLPASMRAFPWETSRKIPISSFPTSDLSWVSTAQYCRTFLARVRAMLWLRSGWLQWSDIVSISLKDPFDIHCGLVTWVSGDGGFYNDFKAWNFISARFKVPVYGSNIEEVRCPRRYTLLQKLGCSSNCVRRAKMLLYEVPVVSDDYPFEYLSV